MKRILIIGGSGSWGQELTRQTLQRDSQAEITIYSRGEHRQVDMARQFNNPRLHFTVGDVRDRDKLLAAARNMDQIFHLAALKHVPVCERNPDETVKTNILGTLNAVDAALANEVEQFVLVSTDKAVDPINTYGVSKSMAEKIVTSANQSSNRTTFVCIRGGNVLGTQGSVVPLFKEQLIKGNEITITDPEMTRYLMRLQDAISLIFAAVEDAKGGEIFVMKMPSIRVKTLAEAMVRGLGNKETKIKIIGRRPGEKLHEALVSRHEGDRTFEHGNYFVVLPTMDVRNLFTRWGNPVFLQRDYTSDDNRFLSPDELDTTLQAEGWLNRVPVADLDKLSKQQLIEFFTNEGWR